MDALDYGLIPTIVISEFFTRVRNSFTLWDSIRIVSAVVTHPLQAKQSYKETLAVSF
jgi:hypothetical protein